MNAEAHRDVEVFVAVDVPDLRAGGMIADNRVHQFFPQQTETEGVAAVGQIRPVFLHQTFRFARAGVEPSNEAVEVLLLSFGEPGSWTRLDWLVGDVDRLLFDACFGRARRRWSYRRRCCLVLLRFGGDCY